MLLTQYSFPQGKKTTRLAIVFNWVVPGKRKATLKSGFLVWLKALVLISEFTHYNRAPGGRKANITDIIPFSR